MSTSADTRHAEVTALAVEFLDVMMSCADVETIGRTAWWDRARTALETGASHGTRYSEIVSKTADKLQITGALSQTASTEISRIGKALEEQEIFGEWRETLQRDAIYITAATRVLRVTRRKVANP